LTPKTHQSSDHSPSSWPPPSKGFKELVKVP
jgi:hypothetical protein